MGPKNTGWDFSIGGSTGTGTVRSVLRPPQMRDKKPDVPLNQSTSEKILDSGNLRSSSSASGSVLHTSSDFSMRKDANHLGKQENYDEDVWYSYPFLCICVLVHVYRYFEHMLLFCKCYLNTRAG